MQSQAHQGIVKMEALFAAYVACAGPAPAGSSKDWGEEAGDGDWGPVLCAKAEHQRDGTSKQRSAQSPALPLLLLSC